MTNTIANPSVPGLSGSSNNVLQNFANAPDGNPIGLGLPYGATASAISADGGGILVAGVGGVPTVDSGHSGSRPVGTFDPNCMSILEHNAYISDVVLAGPAMTGSPAEPAACPNCPPPPAEDPGLYGPQVCLSPLGTAT